MLREAWRVIVDAWAGVRTHLGTLVFFEIVIAVIAASVIVPLATWVGQTLVRSSGRPAVSNFDLVAFGLTPGGMTLIVLLALGYVGTRVLHEALVVTTIVSHTPGWKDTIARISRCLPRLVTTVAMMLGVIAIVCLPLAGLALLAAATMLGEHDINYYLAERPPAFRRLALIVGAIVLAGIAMLWTLSVLLSFASSLVIFEDERPWPAIRRSVRTAWHARGRTITAHLTLTIILAMGTSVIGLFMWLIQEGTLTAAGASLAGVLVGVAMLLTLQALVAIALGFLTFSMRSAVIARLYQRIFSVAEVPIVDASPLASRRWAAGGVLALIAAGTVGVSWLIVSGARLSDSTLITAHRGSSMRAPENTLSAIQAAIDDGADVVEIDVQETSDGEVVVLHDKDLMRIAADPRRVWEMTAAQIRQVDIGSWFDPAFADERIPTLREVIGVVRGRARLLIELKYNGHDVALARRVIDIVREEGIEDACMIMSLDMKGVEETRRLAPGIPVGAIVATSVGDPARLDVDFLALSADKATSARVGRYTAAGRGVLVWTVNAAPEINRFYDLGVEGIITDDVALAVSIRDARAEMTLAERILLWFRHRMD